MTHVFINTQKSAFRPISSTPMTSALPSLAPVETISEIPGVPIVPAAANVIEFIFWGSAAEGYEPAAADFQIVRWERLAHPRGVDKDFSSLTELFIPIVVVDGSATFGGMTGIEDGLINENDNLADEFTVSDDARIEKSVIFTPNDGVCGTISVDNHGCDLFTVYIDGDGTEGYNAGYRFW